MALVIKQVGSFFVLYDDGIVFDKYASLAEAEKQKAEIELEDKLADAVSDAVDDMVDKLKEQFPTVGAETIRLMIVENLS